MIISLSPQFKRQYKRLDPNLKIEVREKIEDFKTVTNHQRLKVHALKGRLKGSYSFSVNYKVRIVFEYESETSVVLLAVGGHDVYNA